MEISIESYLIVESSLRAVFTHSNISTTSMEVNWRDPSQDAHLVQRYILEISEYNGYFTVNKSVARQNQYLVTSHFVPGHLYTVTITSVVSLNDVGKTVYIKNNELHLVVGMFLLSITNKNAFLFVIFAYIFIGIHL